MSDVPVLDGDLIRFNPTFGPRTVTPLMPAVMRGSGHATSQGRRLCILGDEAEVQVSAQYIAPGFPTFGMGIITIAALGADQQAPWCRDGAPVLLRGNQFTARFTPTVLATNPAGAADPTGPGPGTGSFMPLDLLVRIG